MSLIFTQLFYPGCQNTVTGCVRPGAAVCGVATICCLLLSASGNSLGSYELQPDLRTRDTGHGEQKAVRTLQVHTAEYTQSKVICGKRREQWK